MINTKQKFEQAKYFLKRMAEEVTNREPFKYNLSAFLFAARSVTFVMQSEYKNIPSFSEWYKEKEKQMKDRRNIALKRKSISPPSHIVVSLKAIVTLTAHIGID